MASRLAFEAPTAADPNLMPGASGVKRAPRTPMGGTAFGVPPTAQTVSAEDLWSPLEPPRMPLGETPGGTMPPPTPAPAPAPANPYHPELGAPAPPPVSPVQPVEPRVPGLPGPTTPETPFPVGSRPRRVGLDGRQTNLITMPTGPDAPPVTLPPPGNTPAPPPPITTPTGIDENTGVTVDPSTPAPPPGTPAPTGGQNFGDLSNPSAWIALVNNQPALVAWIKANNPGWSDGLVNYYAGVIKGQPGANPNEQAGSAQYYLGKFQQDPFYGGNGGGEGGSGNYNIGGDALSGSITDALMALLQGGGTPYQAEAWRRIMELLDNGGQTPAIKGRLIGAREDAARAQQSLMADASGALADRGLISTPGVAQGAEVGALERITQNVGKDYASAVRDIENNALDQSNASFMSALQMATGMSQNQASTLLSAIGAGTNRQTALAGIALQSLSLNQDWNKFLAQNSLDQTRLMFDIQNGKISTLVPLLQQFISYLQTLNQGAI